MTPLCPLWAFPMGRPGVRGRVKEAFSFGSMHMLVLLDESKE